MSLRVQMMHCLETMAYDNSTATSSLMYEGSPMPKYNFKMTCIRVGHKERTQNKLSGHRPKRCIQLNITKQFV